MSSRTVSCQERVYRFTIYSEVTLRRSTDKVVDPEKPKTGCQGDRNCGSICGHLKGERSSFNSYCGDGGEINSALGRQRESEMFWK